MTTSLEAEGTVSSQTLKGGRRGPQSRGLRVALAPEG